MGAKILVIDDEPELLELLELNLSQQGYAVHTANNAAEAMARIRADKPDLILLDIMLPDISGIKLTASLKNTDQTADIPIILVTAKDTDTDIVVGLSVGADDYVTKPFSTAVLSARIDALLRRTHEAPPIPDYILLAGPIKIIPANHEVFVNDKPIELTLTEFKILDVLIKANGAVLSRRQLMEELGSNDSGRRIIPVHISSLRKKLGTAKGIIKTVHRLGYRAEI